jgi:ATP-dependent DNA helicase RecQ
LRQYRASYFNRFPQVCASLTLYRQSDFLMPAKKPRSVPQIKKKSGRKKVKPVAPPHAAMADKIAAVAREKFGFTSLRPGQEEAIRSLLEQRDALVVMPTGSGKSAIYQIAGLLLNGPVLVVSPLIALQKDQVDSINQHALSARAVVINSAQPASETRRAFEEISDGTGKFIFLAPEQLHKSETVEALEKARPSLIVIDEAHCISEWGHDFRPDYLQLGSAIERLGHPPVLAMTATASQQVRDEIVQRLCLEQPNIFVHGFDRPNIYLRVDHFESAAQKQEALIHRVRWAEKPGVVYVGTRKDAETIMRLLDEEGIRALFYHGGLKASERHQIQDQFMAGEAEVIVATNAFGMGIDKADIRFVFHYQISDSLDSYYQEIGRAGRDGQKAEAALFFRHEDIGSQEFKTSEGKLDPQQVETIAEAIADHGGWVAQEEIADQAGVPQRTLIRTLHRLEDVGAVETLPTGEVLLSADADLAQAARAAAEEQDRRHQMKRERLAQMQDYADATTCRREHLLRYFGDHYTGPCQNCDICIGAESAGSLDPNVGTRREVA